MRRVHLAPKNAPPIGLHAALPTFALVASVALLVELPSDAHEVEACGRHGKGRLRDRGQWFTLVVVANDGSHRGCDFEGMAQCDLGTIVLLLNPPEIDSEHIAPVGDTHVTEGSAFGTLEGEGVERGVGSWG